MVKFQDIDIGYSQSGAAEFQNQIHQEAIVQTKDKLGDINGIRSALEAGWQGKAELNFMQNFEKAVKDVQDALDEIDQRLSEEFDAIEASWVEQDINMVDIF